MLRFSCSKCSKSCEHLGAVFSLILEEKLALGLSAPPPEKKPVETLSDQELLGRAIQERAERAKTEKMRMISKAPNVLWTDYAVTSYGSGKTYRVALRGWERGDSYCSCPDFRKNTLGVCKHIFFVMNGVQKRFDRKVKNAPYRP